KCFRGIPSPKNLASNSLQFVSDLVGQWENERGVDTLKGNVQPRSVVERTNLSLGGFAPEVHDDVLRESVLFANSEYGKELIEVCLRKPGVYREAELYPFFKRSDNSSL